MPKFIVPASAKAARTLLEPEKWYRFKVTRYTPKKAKTDGSWNHIIELTGTNNAAVVTRFFNEKMPQFAIEFIEACGVDVSETEDTSVDFDQAIGTEVEAYIVHRKTDDDKLINDAKDFRRVVLA